MLYSFDKNHREKIVVPYALLIKLFLTLKSTFYSVKMAPFAHAIVQIRHGVQAVFIFTAAVFLSGCNQAVKPNSAFPSWINNPGDGVVASCGFHIQGPNAQQDCAMTRARERLAARQGVEVSSVSFLNTEVANDRERITLNKGTIEKVESKTVRARVKDTFYDAQRDLYYVWMEAY